MHRSMIPSIVVGLVSGLAFATVASANTIGGSPVAPAGAPRSNFANEPGEPGFAKDPFFPKTTRFNKKPEPIVETNNVIPTQPDFPVGLELKGVSLVAGRKLAIINYQTVAELEEFSIRINGKPVKGQCVEIKDKSAILKVNGVTKEIPLRSGVQ